MTRIAIVLSALVGALALTPALAGTNDPTSPFYLLPTQNAGTTLHGDVPSAERK